ncbi:oxidoreductase [Novosphingobium indicum]|uniref:Oxidoreductase n=1 Tax=Novosphingobium indicum TaxID=462949 RepID=A0ABQ2K0E7_9SPHN|nr:SDR family NAD(P)-dependent oxidoreductase [Novosphingobium indicum]GGN61679.1 oxidoreductase [Novosphingobium indicum]
MKGAVLVTGASSGIGAAYACQLARRGCDLVLVARRVCELERVAEQVCALGRKAEVIGADLADPDSLERVEARLRRGVDGLVNNAGFGNLSPFGQSDLDLLSSMIAVNVTAVVRLTHAALPGMLARKEGAIVNVGSGVVYRPIPDYATYIATKAFVTEFTAALALDHGGSGVRFHLAVPGVTRTEFSSIAAGVSLEGVRSTSVMEADAFVEAALAGFDQGEAVTIPALDDPALHDALIAARKAVGRHVTASQPAKRYGVGTAGDPD